MPLSLAMLAPPISPAPLPSPSDEHFGSTGVTSNRVPSLWDQVGIQETERGCSTRRGDPSSIRGGGGGSRSFFNPCLLFLLERECLDGGAPFLLQPLSGGSRSSRDLCTPGIRKKTRRHDAFDSVSLPLARGKKRRGKKEPKLRRNSFYLEPFLPFSRSLPLPPPRPPQRTPPPPQTGQQPESFAQGGGAAGEGGAASAQGAGGAQQHGGGGQGGGGFSGQPQGYGPPGGYAPYGGPPAPYGGPGGGGGGFGSSGGGGGSYGPPGGEQLTFFFFALSFFSCLGNEREA